MTETMQLILLFILMNVINCVAGTVKSICTVRGGISLAASANALAYGVNTVVTFYIANYNISLMNKALIVGGCNLVGVAIVKLIEQALSKDTLWKFELTVKSIYTEKMKEALTFADIPYYYHEGIGSRTIFAAFSETRDDSKSIKEIAKLYNAKMFANETAKIWQ